MAGVSYPSTWTELCNAALGRLSAGSITDFDTDIGPTAEYCRLHLGSLLEEIGTDYDWNGLSKRAELEESAAPPAFGYEYSYDLPADFLRLIEVDSGGEGYTIEGTKFLTNATGVKIRYVFRPTQPSEIPRHMVAAIIAGLAFKLSTPLTSVPGLQQEVKDEYLRPLTGALAKAQAADATLTDEQTTEEVCGYTWYDELR